MVGNPVAFIVHARDRAEVFSEAEPDVPVLRVTTAQPIRGKNSGGGDRLPVVFLR